MVARPAPASLVARVAVASLVASLVAFAARAAAADDGEHVSTALGASVAVGPIPDDGAVGRVDATVGATMWHRLHIGLGGGLGMGSETSYLVEAFGEAGLWLHGSTKLDVLIAWRLGGAHYTIHGAPTDAVMTSALVELRFHLRPRMDLAVQPFTLTAYRNGLWAVMAGPAIGIAVPW